MKVVRKVDDSGRCVHDLDALPENWQAGVVVACGWCGRQFVRTHCDDEFGGMPCWRRKWWRVRK